jgi:predicted transcriptional regulator
MSTTLNHRVQEERLNNAIAMLKVIAHPTRLAVVDLLSTHGKLNVIEIQAYLAIPQAIASQHLCLMENKGVLLSEKIGRKKYLWLKFPKMQNIIQCLENCCQDL